MCERSSRRSVPVRDASSRYSIDTLFPGLSSGSAEAPSRVCPSALQMGLRPEEESSLRSSPRHGGCKRKAGSPLKPATQPKQMSLLSSTKMSRKNMFEAFQPWVLNTYGDSAKTKTITKKKYVRIVKTLRGEEINNAENSKFRFWVKAKGFSMGAPGGLAKDDVSFSPSSPDPDLFVPTTVKDGNGVEKSQYKRVAVVERFFDIIYTVHVETEAKNGKHAGQKRTYRAITEKYAFLPREAVTKFLLQCMECQKRGSPPADAGILNNTNNGLSHQPLNNNGGGKLGARNSHGKGQPTFDPNFSLPFTTTYLRQMRLKNEAASPPQTIEESAEEEPSIPSSHNDEDTHMSDLGSMDDENDHIKVGGSGPRSNKEPKVDSSEIPAPVEWLGYHPIGLKKEHHSHTNNNIYSNGKHDFREQSSPLSMGERSSGGNHEDRQDETSSNGAKDEDEDEDDDEKIDQPHDPERLKAFNMFVRLFVDENLDRMVPISKQPKEKIQAIIDSCTRQFPEFAERARKRIRTYLKSCRRNKRSRDTNGWESSRPTPAHLTSVQAEQILAQACENESQNAKRMRMGLDPVSQPHPNPSAESNGHDRHGHSNSSSANSSPEKREGSNASSSSGKEKGNSATLAALVTSGASADLLVTSSTGNGSLGLSVEQAKTLVNNPLLDYRALNGNGVVSSMSMYRPNFGQPFQRPGPFPGLFPPAAVPPPAPTTTFPPLNASPLPLQNDAVPTDLSMKTKPLLAHKLNATEMATVRSLITGYRESAAFLLRSADELEQLLIQQQ